MAAAYASPESLLPTLVWLTSGDCAAMAGGGSWKKRDGEPRRAKATRSTDAVSGRCASYNDDRLAEARDSPPANWRAMTLQSREPAPAPAPTCGLVRAELTVA